MTNLRDHQESGSYADDLERWIAYRLLEAAPDDFLRLDLRALVLRDFLDVRLAVVPPQGPPRSAPLPDDARDCLVWLREEMAATDGYPWVSFRMFVDDGLDFGSVFNHTLDPCWDAEVPPEVWEADREAFPRPPVPGQPAHGGPVPAAGHPGERRLAGHLRLTLPSHWSRSSCPTARSAATRSTAPWCTPSAAGWSRGCRRSRSSGTCGSTGARPPIRRAGRG